MYDLVCISCKNGFQGESIRVKYCLDCSHKNYLKSLKKWRNKNQEKIKKYREDNKEKMEKYKERNKEEHKKYMKEYNKEGYVKKKEKERRRFKTKYIRIKEALPKKCQICGFDEVLDIHHLIGRKNKNDFSLKRIKEYVVLCPNCHAKIHRLKYTFEDLKKGIVFKSPALAESSLGSLGDFFNM